MSATELERQVNRARRLLWLNRWLRQFGWAATIGGLGFIITVIVQRLVYPGIPLTTIAGVLVGLVAAGSLVWLAIRHEDRVAAAEAIDEAAGLRERITSGLYCMGDEDPFARSVYADAVRTAQRVTVGRHLSVRYPRSFNWAGSTLIAALLVLWLMPSYDLLGLLARQQEIEKQRKALETTQVAVQQTMERVKQLAENNPALKDIEGFQDLVDPKTDGATDPDELKRDAIKRLDRLEEKLKAQQESAQSDELQEIKKMLQRLGEPQQAESAVDKLRQGLAKGDFQSAQKAIKELQEKLAKAKSEGNEAQVQAMQKQLSKLADEMDKLASQKRLEQELKKSGLREKDAKDLLENLSKRDLESIKKELEKKGLSPEQVKKLMKQVAKSKAACAKCKGLAKSMQAAAQSMKGQSGLESGEAAAELNKVGEQLSAMEMMEQELNDMQATLAELAEARQNLAGDEPSMGELGQSESGMGRNMASGRGGRAPREETGTKSTPERIRDKQSPGSIVGDMFVDGEQLKGEAYEKAVEAVSAAARDATEALERDRVPRLYQRPVKNYFGKIQEGLEKPKTETKP